MNARPIHGLLLAVLLSGTALAQRPVSIVGSQIMQGSDYLHYHRDLKYRLDGLAHLDNAELPQAHAAFVKASRYADKPSQAMVAQMYWRGDGVARDRALAYAWMDLAAERGYPSFVAFRETYWAQLTPAERSAAVERGRAVFADHADAVAKPRLEHLLRKKRTTFTDSRVGVVARGLKILVVEPGTGLWARAPRDQVLATEFWNADSYFAWQDRLWARPPAGVVSVGEPIADDGPDPNAEP